MFQLVSLAAAWCSGPEVVVHRLARCTRPVVLMEDVPLPKALADWADSKQSELLEMLPQPPDDDPPEKVVEFCMNALQENDSPHPDTGKCINWVQGGDMVRSIHDGDLSKFLQWTRRSPVFDCLVDCESWSLDRDTLTLIPGTPTRGALSKVIVNVIPREATVDGPHAVRGRIGKPPSRAFMWTMQQQRRPPRIGAWHIYQLVAVDHAIELTD